MNDGPPLAEVGVRRDRRDRGGDLDAGLRQGNRARSHIVVVERVPDRARDDDEDDQQQPEDHTISLPGIAASRALRGTILV
jgi:hypothetical protein